MDRQTLHDALRQMLEGRRLLAHPFYRRWTAGEVSREELSHYAAQYRHFERGIPPLLQGIAERASAPGLRGQALQNLRDETGPGPSHLELFEEFAGALGASAEAEPSPAMARLLEVYRAALEAGPAAGFAALWAYEAQSPEVSAEKARGLRDCYGLPEAALTFWETHATLDVDHARWAVDAVADAVATPDEASHWAHESASAWWGFLDEREALRPV
ncbi:MAG: TenA family transcriptional regulator [Deltaproteobacteria bacterium]